MSGKLTDWARPHYRAPGGRPFDEDDGIDLVVEFTDDDGNGIGKGLCLPLKAGNSHLMTRKVGRARSLLDQETAAG